MPKVVALGKYRVSCPKCRVILGITDSIGEARKKQKAHRSTCPKVSESLGKINTLLHDGRHLLGLNLISNEPVEFEFRINDKNRLILEGPFVKPSKIHNSRLEGAN